jgi:hypothetical protein
MAIPFRLVPLPDDEQLDAGPEPEVSVRLADLLPLVALADRHHYLWLRDFLDDEVKITADLHEVLQAFRCYRPSA